MEVNKDHVSTELIMLMRWDGKQERWIRTDMIYPGDNFMIHSRDFGFDKPPQEIIMNDTDWISTTVIAFAAFVVGYTVGYFLQ